MCLLLTDQEDAVAACVLSKEKREWGARVARAFRSVWKLKVQHVRNKEAGTTRLVNACERKR